MVQESTMICIDNSEWMRNGDFSPSRFESQRDAVNLICGTKIRQNPENTVGLLSNAGKAVEVCATLTTDAAKMLSALHKVKILGESDFLGAIQVAALALRHRQNKRQEQRIVIFVGSPIKQSVDQLKKVGAMLKKNKVAVDIVNFGEENAEENQEKLQAFHAAVNNRDNSNLVTIPPGTSQLSEILANTPIIRSQGEGDVAAGPAEGLEFGVDPNMDPDLLEALRLSVQTAEAEARARNPNDVEMKDATPATTGSTVPSSPGLGADFEDDEDMDDELRQALLLSMQTAVEDQQRDKGSEEKMDIDPSPQAQEKTEEKKEGSATAPNTEPDMSAVNSAFIADVFSNLPGVDQNDPQIQALLRGIIEDKKDESKEGEKKDENK